MSIEESLTKFKKAHEEMVKALESLKSEAKEEGAKLIQKYIQDNQFNDATGVIQELDEFTQVEMDSNAEDIINSVERIFKPETNKVAAFKLDKAVGNKEERALEIIGYSGDSRQKDLRETIEESTLQKLYNESYLNIEQIPCGKDMLTTFELSEKGKRKFTELFGDEPNESMKSKLEKEYRSLEKGYFLYDIEQGLKKRGFGIHELTEEAIEVSKDDSSYYLTPDFGQFSEEDYFDILDRKNELKNIGFIAKNFAELKKARNAMQKWVLENESKCSFLTVHFTSIHNIETSSRIFETVSL